LKQRKGTEKKEERVTKTKHTKSIFPITKGKSVRVKEQIIHEERGNCETTGGWGGSRDYSFRREFCGKRGRKNLPENTDVEQKSEGK